MQDVTMFSKTLTAFNVKLFTDIGLGFCSFLAYESDTPITCGTGKLNE